ncbi:phosphate transport system permease protein PstA [Clostridium tetani]|uniref:Phosphate transport system permease protein PstA n=1 Tax=Clostridium tetani TaxID=1513 RepID=A0A4Q0VFY6_CLOTA|nr:phosphate ABC transporter permease PstA [Clostridium tetani]RXI50730.1 phosphate ABC transporter permease PtsA [Clostridium tetani]BDR66768.1 phosphate transport system permease protein PstA [Clostridium tetani]BDR72257.1 phosphate transport system permease protein PstA [Clostridium tetani]BDR80728.1 phosphate transport system permease protein PstA [Clostridium tetani]BDR89183.1 phosphate transport system permease protein PstA [Clostridium tetani]
MNVKIQDKIWTTILYFISAFMMFLLIYLIGYILIEGIGHISFSFLTTDPLIGEAGGGIAPQLFNSFYMLIISLLMTIPISIGAGIYLAEYAQEGPILNIIRLSIETMASLPSIVVGLFGLLIFVKATGWGFTLLSGALAISILNLPSMTRISENAIRISSKGLKEGSIALGATRWQTMKNVVLPVATPQILTGIILAGGRIFGEAAALLYTSGMSAPPLSFSLENIFSVNSPFNPMRPAETLAVYIWQVNSEGMIPDATKVGSASSAILIIIVLIFNIMARIIGNLIHRKYVGEK